MYAPSSDRPGLEEQYLIATNTSDLTLNPDRVDAATHLIAAGLLGNRMGEALVHLRAEWDGAAKPRKFTEAELLLRAGQLPKKHGKPDIKRARMEALVWFAAAMRKRAHHLRGWGTALGVLKVWAQERQVDPDLLSPALYHWLAPGCPVCDGRGAMKLPDAPALGKTCHHCAGSGKWPRPLGAERIHDWLKGCIGKAKADRGGLLNERIDAGDLRERTENRPKPAPEESSAADSAAVAEHFRLSMGHRAR